MASGKDEEVPQGLSQVVEYRVDRRNVIISVGANWNTFAKENNAASLLGDGVVGIPLHSFVAGDATRMFIEALLRSARALGRPLVRPYRCDSPDCRRYMEMVLLPSPSGEVTLQHRVLREERFTRPIGFRLSESGGAGVLIRCSMCNRLKGAHDWVDAETIAASDGRGSLPVIYGVCPACMESIRGKR